MDFTQRAIRLELRDTFRIAREESDHRENVLVEIVDSSGTVGWGEAAPSRYYHQTSDTVTRALDNIQLADVSGPFVLDDVLTGLSAQLGNQSSALAAMDIAFHDLIGKRLGIPLYQLFGLNPSKIPVTSFTIGLATPEEVRRKTEAVADFPVLKVKLGVDNDREIISAIRDVSSATLRVDANAAWTVDESVEKIKWLVDEGVELIEQPLPKDDLDGLRQLTDWSPLTIIADESACTPEDVVRLRGCVHGVNIKLNKCGGLRSAFKMIHVARAQGMQVMLGCFIETSVGISAAAHLSPLVDYADLDAPLLIRNDPFSGLQYNSGQLVLPDRPGLGVEMIE